MALNQRESSSAAAAAADAASSLGWPSMIFIFLGAWFLFASCWHCPLQVGGGGGGDRKSSVGIVAGFQHEQEDSCCCYHISNSFKLRKNTTNVLRQAKICAERRRENDFGRMENNFRRTLGALVVVLFARNMLSLLALHLSLGARVSVNGFDQLN